MSMTLETKPCDECKYSIKGPLIEGKAVCDLHRKMVDWSFSCSEWKEKT
jgi:hypothetical protein